MVGNTAHPLRKGDVKERNEKLVLSLIAKAGRLSRAIVTEQTGLQPPTVMRIFRTLEAEGLIEVVIDDEPTSDGGNRRGRKSVWFRLNPSAFAIIGVDFFARLVSVQVQDFAGRALYSVSKDLPSHLHAHDVLFEVKKEVWGALSATKLKQHQVLGLGIGSPGVVDTTKGTVVFYSRIPGMRNVGIKEDFEATFGCPTILHNNTTVIAQSESSYGPAKGASSMLTFLIRGGLGGAFIKNGEAYVNQGRTAFEIGHMSIDLEDGEVCSDQETGCLEKWVTESALLDLAHQADATVKSIHDLDRAIKNHNGAVRAAMARPAAILGKAALSLSNVLNPKAFVFVSRSEHLSQLLCDHARSFHHEHCYTSKDMEIDFYGRLYDPLLACKGAIDLVLRAFFEGSIEKRREPQI